METIREHHSQQLGFEKWTKKGPSLEFVTQQLRLNLPAFNQDSQMMWHILFLQNTGKNFELGAPRCPLECAILDHGVVAGNCSLLILPIINQASSDTNWKFEWIYISLTCYQSQTYNCFQADATWTTLSHAASPNPLWYVGPFHGRVSCRVKIDIPQNLPFPTPWMRHNGWDTSKHPQCSPGWQDHELLDLKSAWNCSRPGWIRPGVTWFGGRCPCPWQDGL